MRQVITAIGSKCSIKLKRRLATTIKEGTDRLADVNKAAASVDTGRLRGRIRRGVAEATNGGEEGAEEGGARWLSLSVSLGSES